MNEYQKHKIFLKLCLRATELNAERIRKGKYPKFPSLKYFIEYDAKFGELRVEGKWYHPPFPFFLEYDDAVKVAQELEYDLIEMLEDDNEDGILESDQS